ncbi:helix-turn-helix domain-containing protein [Streptomyces sp. MS1.HAVA.3]|uniref:Helix-turn-helix domain-containing protein n=1 Tax=Streptomyces caledonius TaxID=3134107 RepID=A0ABU8U1D6_9ACTN
MDEPANGYAAAYTSPPDAHDCLNYWILRRCRNEPRGFSVSTSSSSARAAATEPSSSTWRQAKSWQLPLHEPPRTPIIDRTRHRHADVQKLVAAGWTISAIARRLHLDRKTVRRFRDTDLHRLLAASANERQPAGVLDPFKPYLNTRFTESLGQVSGSRLFLETYERGYRGSRQVVRKHLAALRAGYTEPIRADIPSPRKITS